MGTYYMSVLEEKGFISDLVKFLETHDRDDIYIGNGSSRIVVDTPACLIEKYYKVWGLNTNREYVIKIAVGLGGKTQMDNEVEAYENYGDYLPLARIPACGKFIEVMEKVDSSIFDSYDENAWFGLYYNRDYGTLFQKGGELELDYDEAYSFEELCKIVQEKKPEEKAAIREYLELHSQIEEAVAELNDNLGYTNDNEQVGQDAEGRIVSYDYGFKGDSWGDSHTWSSPITDNLYDTENLSSYFCKLIEGLSSEEAIDYRCLENEWLLENGYDYDYEELNKEEHKEESEEDAIWD